VLLSLSWNLRYLFGDTRWDTGIVPPELVELIEGEHIASGAALDIGCGTGTNAIYLAQRGFDVLGVDVAHLAIRQARRKAKQADVQARFHTGSFLDLSEGRFDFVLDVGCFHGLLAKDQARYVEVLRHVLNAGGAYLLYAWGPREFNGQTYGLSPDAVQRTLGESYALERLWTGEEGHSPSYWYWFVRDDD
jgi:cyclopropane fatty-acyl-phospholipid synthase-like methyltransferase